MMNRILMAGLGLVITITSIGCTACDCQKCRSSGGGRQGLFANHGGGQQQCNECRNGLCGRHGRGGNGGGGAGGAGGAGGDGGYGAGPGGAAVAYPYYTVRAPRDFLSANPRGIGP